MKKITLLFLLFFGIVNLSSAKEVTPETAKVIAQNFYNQISAGKGGVSLKLIYTKKTSLNKLTLSDIPLFYIFNTDNNNGFVIVSGDDNIQPILGYSSNGTFDNSNLPPNVRMWFDNYESQIRDVISNNIKATDGIKSKWQALEKDQSLYTLEIANSVSPLISTNWSQGTGWNQYCPSDPDGSDGHAKVGCVAVAMGQIMKKWDNPIQGKGSYSYDHEKYGTLSADFGNSTYNWSLMDDDSANQYSAYLLYHCGVSVDMNYGPSESVAYSSKARYALVNYFNYSSDAKYISRYNYSTPEWKNILTHELDNDRPIYYSGRNNETESGHAFVCDGYENSDYFHFNWGWGGHYNGYFYLDDLTPGSRIYNDSQRAIVGIWSSKQDDDSDGVMNHLDYCQDTPIGKTVNKNGCSLEQSIPMDFVTTWKTDNTGTSNSTSITVSMVGSSYDIDWDNDGVLDEFDVIGNITHDFGEAGTYTIRIACETPRIYFNDDGDQEKILSIDQWGTGRWTSMYKAFCDAKNLVVDATDIPNLSNVRSMSYMFYGIDSFNQDISYWDVSSVKYMFATFSFARTFNQDISSWNVNNVTNMAAMFWGARSFNQDISNWDVSNVTDMYGMFRYARYFNQDISSWIVSNVIDMKEMFGNAYSFNQDISNWNVSNVTNMYGMFKNASNFNQNISSWIVSNVTDMEEMFYNVKLSTTNYDNLLNSWSQLSLKNGVSFSGGKSTYCNSEAARSKLINDYGWTIVDGGLDCSSLGISELDLVTSIYPNPVNNRLVISSKLQIEKVEIYSILGKKIKEITKDFNSVDLSNLSNGIYIIRIYSEKGVAVKKLIKQ